MKARKSEERQTGAAQRRKEETQKYSGSVSSYKYSRPSRKVVKRTFKNA